MTDQLTYDSAYEELDRIYQEINNEQVSVDLLAEKVKRAAVLIEFCQSRLRSTEDEINRIISGIGGTTQSTD